MKVLDQILQKVILLTSIFAFWVLFILVFYTVVARLMELSSVAWMDDINNLCIVWMVFMGSVICLRNNEHVTTDFIKNMLKRRFPKFTKYLELMNQSLILVFLFYLFHASWILVTKILQTAWLPSLPIAKAWWFLPILISSALMIAYTIVNTLKIFKENKQP